MGKDSLTMNKQVYLHLMEKKVSPEKRTSKKMLPYFTLLNYLKSKGIETVTVLKVLI